MTHADEKRHFHRILYNAEATLTSQGHSYPCKIIDISLKGCLLELDQCQETQSIDASTLTLTLSDEIKICMELAKTHVHDHLAGFKCVNIDIDSISNLRRLVELNLGNSEILERELVNLSGSV